MPSVVQICNLALSRLGIEQINTIDEPVEAARQCKLHFDNARDNVLREFSWAFARKTQALAQLPESVPGWAFTYSYPSDCLYLIRVFNIENANETDQSVFREMRLGMRAIVTNLPGAYAEYVARINDPDQFDPAFVNALAWRLAVEIGFALTGDSERFAQVLKVYELNKGEAKKLNANERYQPNLVKSVYLKSR